MEKESHCCGGQAQVGGRLEVVTLVLVVVVRVVLRRHVRCRLVVGLSGVVAASQVLDMMVFFTVGREQEWVIIG